MSQKQKSVVLSTTEAEYVAGCEGARELIWVNRLLSELILIKTPALYIDNASAIKLAKNPQFQNFKYHYLREKYHEVLFDIEHVGSTQQLADIMTKPLTRETFEYLRSKLELLRLSDIQESDSILNGSVVMTK